MGVVYDILVVDDKNCIVIILEIDCIWVSVGGSYVVML